jgi:hypothetical protein
MFRAFKPYSPLASLPLLDNGMSLDDFIGKQVEVKACVIKENEGSSIRLKCPKRVINTLGIPERGPITVHIKGNTATVSYGVTGSSMRINLGAAFRELFKGEEGGITITIKASKDGIMELFHKEDEKSLFPIFKSARYRDGWRYCTRCHSFLPVDYTICPKDGIKLRNSPRKKKRNNGNSLYN